jgi:hypothetical protein
MGRKSLSKRQRKWLVRANVVLLAAFCLWHFGVTALFVLEARYVGWKFPAVYRAPMDLVDSSISPAPGRTLSYFGYEFEVPWDDVNEGKMKQVGKAQLIAFRSGNALLFSRMAPKEFVQTFLSSTKADPENVRKLWGVDALESDYALHRLILEITPGQLTLLNPRESAARGAMLLLFKGIMMPRGGESGIFRVRTEGFQGFQFGDPESRPKSLDVEMFSDDVGLSFIFAQRADGIAPAITQAEINRVLRTARKVPEEALSADR